MIERKQKSWAVCGSCGWVGKTTDLINDPDGHPCGKDECPECKDENCISCCLTEAEARNRNRGIFP